MTPMRTRWMWWIAGSVAVAAIGWSFVPRPIPVEVALVSRGPLVVTVSEESRTRVRDRYTISAPVSGYLTRISHRPGAAVRAGQTVARLLPSPPSPLDARTRSQLQAQLDAAVDSLSKARTRVESVRATLAQATRELDSQRQLERRGVIPPQDVDIARTRQQVAESDVQASLAGVDVAEHDVQAARAALLAADASKGIGRATDVRAPRAGTVLKVFEDSERVLSAGTPLLEIGDPAALEIVADLLSTDAVQVSPGNRVLIDRWGGAHALTGRVRLIEPSSFTKVSALGVEEQRVNVVVDFVDPQTAWQRLGDGFALEVRVVTWEQPDVLTIPSGSLFRRGAQWNVFTVVRGRAVEQPVHIGHQSNSDAEVLSGLEVGDRVILHPSEQVRDRTRVEVRQ